VEPFIEPGIRPLVEALNGLDFVGTVYSCEGHFGGPHDEKFLPTAYVTFGATDMQRFVPLYRKLVESSEADAETELRLTYDCVLGRHTLSIWAGPSHREPSRKRSVIDSAIAILAEMIREFAGDADSDLLRSDIDDGFNQYPCEGSTPPCALVIPAKDPVCPFAR